jgi:hypothetical protein
VWISFIHRYPFRFLSLILWRMYTFNNCHMVLVICYLCYLKVAWSWKKIFVLMDSGVLDATHPNLQFDVLHSKKPQCSNAKQKSTFINQ